MLCRSMSIIIFDDFHMVSARFSPSRGRSASNVTQTSGPATSRAARAACATSDLAILSRFSIVFGRFPHATRLRMPAVQV